MKIVIEREDKYIDAEQKNQKYIDAILKSSSPKKVVVAGPGTGKTRLFKQILDGRKNTLTLTFVNSLVEDLSLSLYGLSEVRTLHGYARSILGKITPGVEVFPKLVKVIQEDAEVINGTKVDFDDVFHNRIDDKKLLNFYAERRNYYGGYYGYSDIILTLVEYFEKNPANIPTYDYILVDEFQDFNLLEISLIDLLSQKSPILLAGDDDQALYEELKSANKNYIRDRYGDNHPDYDSFTLPFCRRSTRVIVEAVNDIINVAQSKGLLKGRIDKKYCYFDQEEKDKESASNPYILYTQKFVTQIPWFISKQIDEIARKVQDKFSVLIISPSVKMSQSIADALNGKGFKNVSSSQKKIMDEGATLINGISLLLEHDDDNLGWRIIAKHLLMEDVYKTLLKTTANVQDKPIMEMLDKNIVANIKGMLKSLNSLKNGEDIGDDTMSELLQLFKLEVTESMRNLLLDKLPEKNGITVNSGIRNIPIKTTTVQSSKGLSVDYVFITHFDDQYLVDIKNKIIKDINVYNFLVALTRARKGVYLISSNTKTKPIFLSWINKDRIKHV